MEFNPFAPGRPFDDLWYDLLWEGPTGSVFGTPYGKSFTMRSITESNVTIDLPNSGGLVDIPKLTLEMVYADWRGYRYERLSPNNSQDILYAVSLIDYVVRTWERHEETRALIERARKAGMPDGVFWVVNYNRYSRHIGPRPSGDDVSLSEVFPDELAARLLELESAASSLHEAAGEIAELVYSRKSYDAVGTLTARYPGFSKAAYDSVVFRAFYIAAK